MALNMNATPKKAPKQRPLIPAGPSMARIVQIIDLGLQNQRPYQGQEKPPAYEIWITFEFPSERIEVDGESRPMWDSKRLKLSSHEKSVCYKWYNKLDPDNKFKGDWAKLVGKDCMVLITHTPGKGKAEGITYANISDVMPVMRGMSVPPLENETVLFDLVSPDMEVFNALPEFLQNIIKDNLEYDGSRLQNKVEGNPTRFTARAPGDAPIDVDSDDVSEEQTLPSSGSEPMIEDDESSPWD